MELAPDSERRKISFFSAFVLCENLQSFLTVAATTPPDCE